MKQYQDERTLQVRNRIYAELMRIMLCVVVLSFCIKTLYFHMGLTQCMTEYILMILAPVYQAVRIRRWFWGQGRPAASAPFWIPCCCSF